MNEKHASIVILIVVAISALVVFGAVSYTGMVASYNGYGFSANVYGGAIKKAINENPLVFGKSVQQAVYHDRVQARMLANRDKWVYTETAEALANEYPCMQNGDGRYYCLKESLEGLSYELSVVRPNS